MPVKDILMGIFKGKMGIFGLEFELRFDTWHPNIKLYFRLKNTNSLLIYLIQPVNERLAYILKI